jgi:hypothetical protein
LHHDPPDVLVARARDALLMVCLATLIRRWRQADQRAQLPPNASYRPFGSIVASIKSFTLRMALYGVLEHETATRNRTVAAAAR